MLKMATEKSRMEEIIQKVSDIEISSHPCPLCGSSYSSEEDLKKHIKKEHPETHGSNPQECPECRKVLNSAQALNRHIKPIHRTCAVKEFKLEFETADTMAEHKKVHTTCYICGRDWFFPCNLKLHIISHKQSMFNNTTE